MSKIVCLGIVVADVIAKPVDKFPDKGKLTLVDKIEMHTGGCAVNCSIDLARIGEDVGVMGLVGEDIFGDFVIKALKREGVNIDGMKRTSKGSTSVTLVFSGSDGERSFIHNVGTNGILTDEDVDYSIIEKCDILFIAGSLLMPSFDGEPTARVLKKAKEMGKYTILDTAWDSTGRWMKAIEPCLPHIDLFIPSYDEARMIAGMDAPEDIANLFLKMGVKNVVIKLGEKGCFIKNVDVEYYIEAFKVDTVDTNGAGDAFVAGFITGLVNGWDLKACGEFANAVGAHCIMKIGASQGVKSKEEILEFMKNYKKN
jgi:sugar/nucleoside kinase (ribokinase family)